MTVREEHTRSNVEANSSLAPNTSPTLTPDIELILGDKDK